MKRLTVEQIKRMHSLLCERTGGSDGLRDEGLLESAIFGVEQTFMGIPLYPTVMERGARLGYSLMKNHAFVDGNKRIGVLAMLVYFRLVGVSLALTNEDVVHIGLGVASGEMDYEALLQLLKEKSLEGETK